jgi:Cation efflux system protein CusB domain 1
LPGQTILTLTEGDYVWVTANYKETQLRNTHPGQPAEVEVDAVPGKAFLGWVRSINEATGAATSLLPPENATGNFVKVVQRIPVRIELDPAGDDEDRKYARLSDIRTLRQGMSVSATIDTSRRPRRIRADRNHKRSPVTGRTLMGRSPSGCGIANPGTGSLNPTGGHVAPSPAPDNLSNSVAPSPRPPVAPSPHPPVAPSPTGGLGTSGIGSPGGAAGGVTPGSVR